jgi:hypothetical protein
MALGASAKKFELGRKTLKVDALGNLNLRKNGRVFIFAVSIALMFVNGEPCLNCWT